jgi:RNA 3'-terminal phosphate cyclase (ATP)
MSLIEIDGSQGEGGGQILRTSISLSSIIGVPIKIKNIRAGRKQPGLRPQHLQALVSAASITNSRIIGAEVGSSEIEYYPGEPSGSIRKKIETGTAGSVTLIAQTLIPIGLFCDLELDLEIVGGTEVPASPTIDYLQKIVYPIYQTMSENLQIDLKKRGYYPKGGGIVRVRVKGSSAKLHSLKLDLPDRKNSKTSARILASSSHLPSHVTQRETQVAKEILSTNGVSVEETLIVADGFSQALSPGNSILIFRQNESEFIGASSLGERGKKAEQVGREAAEQFLQETTGRPNVDSHLADMLVTLYSCAHGETRFTTSHVTKHLETNLLIASKISGATFEISEIPERKIYSVQLFPRGEKPI